MKTFAVAVVVAGFAVIWVVERRALTRSRANRREVVAFAAVMALSFALCVAVAADLPVPNPSKWVTDASSRLMRLFSP